MYQDLRNWLDVNVARRNAIGCATDNAVYVESSSGRTIASVQPTTAPQS